MSPVLDRKASKLQYWCSGEVLCFGKSLSRMPMLYRQGRINNHSPGHPDWNYWNQEEALPAWWCLVRGSIKCSMWENGLHIALLWAVHMGAKGYQHGKSIVFVYVEGCIRNECNWFWEILLSHFSCKNTSAYKSENFLQKPKLWVPNLASSWQMHFWRPFFMTRIWFLCWCFGGKGIQVWTCAFNRNDYVNDWFGSLVIGKTSL